MSYLSKKPRPSTTVWARLAIPCLLLALPTWAETELPPLPEGVASFGAAVAGNDLVVFGGHVGRTHQHSIENLSHRFVHLDLEAPDQGWKELSKVEGLQGLPMVPHGREVCRVGGLQARNHVGSEEELFSTDEVRCFDLERRQWRELPPLPQPRSSHDAVVHGDRLYVIGGWQLRGSDEAAVWREDMAVLDLSTENAAWETVIQPFQRRALAVAAADDKVYAFGGLGKEGTSREVEVYDIASGAWSPGPEIPSMAERLKGFGVSAFGVGDRIYLSGGDGVIHSLDAPSGEWAVNLGKLETPRFFHRLLPHKDQLLFVGGAGRKGHLADVEVRAIEALQPGAYQKKSEEPMASPSDSASWPGFRGTGTSWAEDAELPLSWSDEENIPWRTSIPGYGQSAPVLWHGLVFVTSVEGPKKETLILSALSLETGEVHWRRRFPASQEIEASDIVTRGAPTPVVDGDRIYSFWESGDLIALSHEGETLWQRSVTQDYGEIKGNHGLASSPVLTKNAVVVQVTHEGPSYFLAVAKDSGKTLWKADRPARVAWTTPVVVPGKHGEEIISSAAGRVEALDARTGERLWYREGIERNHAPSVAVDQGLVIVASSVVGHNFAVNRLGQGELSDEQVAWTAEGVTSGFGSPVVHGDCVLFVNKAGVVTCVDRSTGEESWKHRVADACWATPIVSEDRIYFFTKKGATTVLGPGEEGPEVLAENSLATSGTIYGVAAAHDAFLVRAGDELIKIGTPPSQLAEKADSGSKNSNQEVSP